jgi:chromosome segregation ATPase
MLTIFSRFSVYIAAVVIFISWLISNSFVRALEEDTQTMDAVQSEQTQAQQFSSLSGGQRDLLRKMADIENSLDKLHNESERTAAEGQGDEDEVDAEQQWVESFQADSAQLAKSSKELEELAKRVEPPGDLDLPIKSSVQQTEAFNAKVQREANAYKQAWETSRSTESGQAETDAEGRKKHDKQMSAAYKALTKMEQEFDKLDQQVVSIYDKLDSYVSERRESSAKSATVASFIAYVFYALGTVIGGLGKWVENKTKGRLPAAT